MVTNINTYSINASAGDKITVCSGVKTQTSGRFGLRLELFNSSGASLASGTDSFKYTFADSGTFYIFAVDSYSDGTGIYRIVLARRDVSCSTMDFTAPQVALAQPNGGEVVENNSTCVIKWSSSDNVGIANQEIRLSIDGGQTYPAVIASGLAADVQSYNWQVPPELSTSKARIKISAVDAQRNIGQNESASDFTIINSSVLPAAAKVAEYTYDKLNRLIRAQTQAETDNIYIYDALGNRLSIEVRGGNRPYMDKLSNSEAAPDETIAILGRNFGARQGSSRVEFDNGISAQIKAWSDTVITCQVPFVFKPEVNVKIVNQDGASNDFKLKLRHGDINRDTKIDITDIVICVNALINRFTQRDANGDGLVNQIDQDIFLQRSDIDRNGQVDLNDVAFIARVSVKADPFALELLPINFPVSGLFRPVPNQQAKSGERVSFKVSATNLKEKAKYSLINVPSGATINQNTGEFSWQTNKQQAGSYVVKARVSYSKGNATIYDEQNINITVQPASTGKLAGYVFERRSKYSSKPLSWVYILLNGNNKNYWALSNYSGAFNIKDIPEGAYSVIAYKMGYLPQRKSVSIKANSTTDVVFYF